MAKYYHSQTLNCYEVEIEPYRNKYMILVDGLPMAFADTQQEAGQVAEEIIRNLQLTAFPPDLQ